jgi:thiamine-phosphate pyrophosphorylase
MKRTSNLSNRPVATQHLCPAAPLCTLNWFLAQFTLPRIYPIVDTATLQRLNLPAITAAEALIEGGARILQLRHKAFWSRETFHLAEAIAAICKSAGVLFVVNDRADYAALLGSALHIGQDDLTPTDARRVLGNQAILGYSTHTPEQMRSAEENDTHTIDYLAFGPMFSTVSKERPDPTVGIEGLKVIRALTRKPLVAIGGITRDNAFTCWNAGADSVAVIADLYPTPCTKITLRDRMAEWQKLTAA